MSLIELSLVSGLALFTLTIIFVVKLNFNNKKIKNKGQGNTNIIT